MTSTKLPQGWMSAAERKWLHFLGRGARPRGYAAEVGSWRGRSTTCLLTGFRGRRLFCVDTWAGTPDDPLQHERLYAGTTPDGVLKDFRRNLATPLAAGRVEIVRMTSLEGARRLRTRLGAGSLEFVFIDADHRYEAVRADILAWLPLVRRGGMVAGHDFNWEGVGDAVRELLPAHKQGPDSLWYQTVGAA